MDRDVRNTGWLFLFLGSLVCSNGLPYLRAYHSERTSLGVPYGMRANTWRHVLTTARV
jgi:hypothetical protein